MAVDGQDPEKLAAASKSATEMMEKKDGKYIIFIFSPVTQHIFRFLQYVLVTPTPFLQAVTVRSAADFRRVSGSSQQSATGHQGGNGERACSHW
jgi:hypothetical protein